MYLLDTNVISELRKMGAGRADAQVARWQAQVPRAACFVSAITLLELELGVLRVERRDAAQAAVLRSWLETRVLPEFSGRVLAIDAQVARCCARLHVPDPRAERDALIAATAWVHGMTVVARNVADFEGLGVPLLNPWQRISVQEPRAAYRARGQARQRARK